MTSIKLLHVSARGCHPQGIYWNKGIPLHYTSRNDIHRTLHLDDKPRDHTDRYRCLYRYTYCVQAINCCESVLEVAHYHTVLISRLCTLVFFKFTCSRVLIIHLYQWWRRVTQFCVFDLCSVVLVDSVRMAFCCRNIWELDICLQLYIMIRI